MLHPSSQPAFAASPAAAHVPRADGGVPAAREDDVRQLGVPARRAHHVVMPLQHHAAGLHGAWREGSRACHRPGRRSGGDGCIGVGGFAIRAYGSTERARYVCMGGGGVRPPTIYPSHKLISAKREPAAAAQSITQVADGAGGHGLGATSWRCLPTWLSVFHTRAVWSLEVDSSRPGTSGDHSTAKARDLRRCGAVRGGARRPQCMVVERRQDADTTLELGGWLAPHHTAAVA